MGIFTSYGYDIIKELGRNREGGRITYLANDIANVKEVVIKQFRFVQGGDWSGYKQIEREIAVLKDLEHSGIPHYIDSFETDDGYCLVQEYKSAANLSANRSFDPQEVKTIAIAALSILVYLQNRIPPVIHRDIKPENILVDDQLNVYLIDFGLARIGGSDMAQSSVVAGTLGFMPPEQLINRELTNASDLYGLGATLICLLTHTKSSELSNLIAIDDDSYSFGLIDFKSKLSNQISSDFIGWLEQMIAPKVKKRYSSAIEALNALQLLSVIQTNKSSTSFVRTQSDLFDGIESKESLREATPKIVSEEFGDDILVNSKKLLEQGSRYVQQGAIDEALFIAQLVISKYGTHRNTLILIKKYLTGIQCTPISITHKLSLASCYQEINEWKNAVAILEDSLALEPNNPEISSNLAIAYNGFVKNAHCETKEEVKYLLQMLDKAANITNDLKVISMIRETKIDFAQQLKRETKQQVQDQAFEVCLSWSCWVGLIMFLYNIFITKVGFSMFPGLIIPMIFSLILFIITFDLCNYSLRLPRYHNDQEIINKIKFYLLAEGIICCFIALLPIPNIIKILSFPVMILSNCRITYSKEFDLSNDPYLLDIVKRMK